jgi:hypothetical protein
MEVPALGFDTTVNVRRHVFWHQHHGKLHRIGNARDGRRWLRKRRMAVGIDTRSWRAGLKASLHAPFGLSSWVDAVLFARISMAAVAMGRH